LAQAGVKVVL